MRTRSALLAVALLCACALPGALGSDGDHDDDRRHHVPGACREFGYPESGWQVDEDCCASYSQSACEDGYDHEVTDEVCFKSGDCRAYKTICTLSDDLEKVTMSPDAVNYECEPDMTGALIFIFVIIPLLVACCCTGCYFTKTCCFHYRRRDHFGVTVAPGVQMAGMPTVYTQGPYGGPQHYAGPQYGGPPQYSQPANQPYTVHQATVQPMQTPYAQPSGTPYTGQGFQDPGIVRYGQNKVPTV